MGDSLTPTPEDLARDLLVDLADWSDVHREVVIALTWFAVRRWEELTEGHLEPVLDLAGNANTGWPAAIRRALAAEAERDTLRVRVKVLEEEVDYYHDFLAREQAYALSRHELAQATIAELSRQNETLRSLIAQPELPFDRDKESGS